MAKLRTLWSTPKRAFFVTTAATYLALAYSMATAIQVGLLSPPFWAYGLWILVSGAVGIITGLWVAGRVEHTRKDA